MFQAEVSLNRSAEFKRGVGTVRYKERLRGECTQNARRGRHQTRLQRQSGSGSSQASSPWGFPEVSVSSLKSSKQKTTDRIYVTTAQVGWGWGQAGGSRGTGLEGVTTSPGGGLDQGGSSGSQAALPVLRPCPAHRAAALNAPTLSEGSAGGLDFPRATRGTDAPLTLSVPPRNSNGKKTELDVIQTRARSPRAGNGRNWGDRAAGRAGGMRSDDWQVCRAVVGAKQGKAGSDTW